MQSNHYHEACDVQISEFSYRLISLSMTAACAPSLQGSDQDTVISFLNKYNSLANKNWENRPKMVKLTSEYKTEFTKLVKPGEKMHDWSGKIFSVQGKSHSKPDRLGAITFIVGRNTRATCDIFDKNLMDKVTEYSIKTRVKFSAKFKQDTGSWFSQNISPHLYCDLLAISK